MTLDQVKTIRSELHHLAGKERHNLTIRIALGGDGVAKYHEAYGCFIWDDSKEVVYVIAPNTVQTQTTDSRLFPMSITAIDYNAIESMTVEVDRLCLDNFLKTKVSEGLTNEETRQRYYDDMTKLFEDETYMTNGYQSTEKRERDPDYDIVDKNATKFL